MKSIRQQILDNVNIVDVVSRYVDLQKQGQNYKCICPFHDDTNPSLVVNEDKQIFKCFVCETGGTALEFMQKYEKIPMEEVYQKLSKEIGIKYKEIKRLPEEYLLEDILNFYTGILDVSKLGETSRIYLQKRNIPEDIINKFKLGFAPGGDFLRKYLEQQMKENEKYTQLTIDKMEVFNQGGKDFFNNRIIIPIFDETNKVRGFSGRVLDDGNIKYLNSKESNLFHKNNLLYNLNNFDKSDDYLYIVEGFFDVITAAKNGINNIVATMGVALTNNHLQLLSKNNIKRIYLGFDNDNAGKAAIDKNALTLIAKGYDVFVLDYGDVKDIDEYFQKEENTKEKLKDTAIPYYKYIINQYNYEDIDEKIELTKDLKEIIQYIEEGPKKEIIIDEIAGQINLSRDILNVPTIKINNPKTSDNSLNSNNSFDNGSFSEYSNYPEFTDDSFVNYEENYNVPIQPNQNNNGFIENEIKSNVHFIDDKEKLLLYIIAHDKEKFLYLKEKQDKGEIIFDRHKIAYEKLENYYKENQEIDLIMLLDEIPEFNEILMYINKYNGTDEYENLNIDQIVNENKIKKQIALFKLMKK